MNIHSPNAQAAPLQTAALSDLAVIGAGTMGGNLALNLVEHGFQVSLFDRDPDCVEKLTSRAGALRSGLHTSSSIQAVISSLKTPRCLLLMVPAGEAIDQIISSAAPLLSAGDLIIDAGNSNFRDTARRHDELSKLGLSFMGLGVSGGEDGARHGPALMAGGSRTAWERVAPMLEAIAADHQGSPCAAHVGVSGSGHLVKTVHNGIEYGDMQMIAELYGLLHTGMALDYEAISAIFEVWRSGDLKSYLIDITCKILSSRDVDTDQHILDVILDSAGQKGTGRWTAIEALMLGAPASVTYAAIEARVMSSRLQERITGAQLFADIATSTPDLHSLPPEDLEAALVAGKIISYAQGFDIIADAARENAWDISLARVSRVWRGGCIIRSEMLEQMAAAFDENPTRNLMHAPYFAELLRHCVPKLRRVVAAMTLAGCPAPALSAALAYFDMSRSLRSTANVIQAQRDFFGAHGFRRRDREGAGFHGPWATAVGA